MADVVIDAESKNPKQLLGQGIKAYILQDYDSAVAALSKASELLVTEHGSDLHESLGEVYLYYGKSLLGLSREESNVLGDAIPKKNEDSEEEQGNGEDSEETADETCEKQATLDETCDEKAENSDQNVNPEEATESTDDKENEDEPTDLQVAWEVLELAKKIYQKQGENGKRYLAETLIVLGEISLESENFSAAIEDIKQGLEIQKAFYEKDSRKIAETYYKLGIAYSTDSQIDEAIESFNGSLEYLKNRIENIEKISNGKDEIEEEINEIKSLIPDIEEKIADMKTYKDEVCQCDIRATIKNFVEKPNFTQLETHDINKLEARRRPDIETALKNINLENK